MTPRKPARPPRRPDRLSLRGVDPLESEHGEIRCLARRGKGNPHVLLDLRKADGCMEIGLTEARRLHSWLRRWIDWRWHTVLEREHKEREGSK